MNTCTIGDCTKSLFARGWCAMHYGRWRKHGDPDYVKPVLMCSIPDCTRTMSARGWCKQHYQQWKRVGDPTGSKPHGPKPGARKIVICSKPSCEQPARRRNTLCQHHYDEFVERFSHIAICSVEGCHEQASSRGWCNAHYCRWRKYGDPTASRRIHVPGTPVCSEPDCTRPALSPRGLCHTHYRHWRLAHADDPDRRIPREVVRQWFEEAMDTETDECLVPPFGSASNGYPRELDGTPMHRLACEREHGPAPTPRHQTCHAPIICHNPGCVNRRHVRWGTPPDNCHDIAIDGRIAANRKLSDDLVILARTLHRHGVPTSEIARQIGTNYRSADLIVRGLTYRDIQLQEAS